MKSEIGRSIDALIRDALVPELEPAGFRRQARTFRRAAGDATQVMDLQGSKYNEGADGKFTINVGIYFPAAAALMESPGQVSESPSTGECLVRMRIGRLMPGQHDHWWTIHEGTDLVALGQEVVDAWQRYGAPWFDTVPDLRRAGQVLEAEGSSYLGAVAALATGDRPLASARLSEALASFPNVAMYRSWGTRHGLFGEAAAVATRTLPT